MTTSPVSPSPAPAALRKRRRLVVAAAVAGLGAAAAGGFWHLRRSAGAHDASELWGLALPTPQGGVVRLADWRGRRLVVNFWATWCPPCIEEMPMLDAFYQEAGGLPVLGVAADRQAPVQRFLQRVPVRFPIGVLEAGGLDLTRRLGNDKGGLPFSLLLGADGRIAALKTGQLSPADLQQWARG
ncbi:MAG: Thiol-disulfide oxidoreductase ResA [Paracidovorax wautersii]|uniref:Thiol-disulfide oxidoreductase ResA n=1 Tax=Paracidovorax wautersii TaxID=1177982 RepID=A0A7V8FMC5_9BURK|nr:MAG: Thiol-disulfide oxidoreductase ResA [Paracidovorax wautersii]